MILFFFISKQDFLQSHKIYIKTTVWGHNEGMKNQSETGSKWMRKYSEYFFPVEAVELVHHINLQSLFNVRFYSIVPISRSDLYGGLQQELSRVQNLLHFTLVP